MHWVDSEPARADHATHDVNDAGAAYLNGISGDEFWIVIGSRIGSGGIECNCVCRLSVTAMRDVNDAACIRRKAAGSGDEVEHAMVKCKRIDAGVRDFSKNAHILTCSCSDEHGDNGVQQHPFGNENGFNCVRGRRFVHADECDFADHGQQYTAPR